MDRGKTSSEYRAAFPFKVLLGIAVVFAGIITLHLTLTARQVEQLRAEVFGRIEAEIEPVREALVAQRAEVSALALARYHGKNAPGRDALPRATVEPALSEPDAPFVAEGITLARLREAPALTLRLRRVGELDEESVRLAVEHGAPDDIGNCLGVPNQPASMLYAGEDFLGEGFAEQVRAADSALELRGQKDQLERRITEVLPEIRRASRSGYLFLAIDRPGGEEIEVYIVDLETERDVLRLVTKAEGRFVSALVAVGGVSAKRADEAALTGVRGAVDCGVASRIRALLPEE